MIINILLISFAILCLLAAIFFTWTLLALVRTRVPFVPSSGKKIQAMLDIAQKYPEKIIIDLGCGTGDILFAGEKRGFHGIGYEYVWPVYLVARLRKKIQKSNVELHRGDFFKAHFDGQPIIMCYLFSSLMERIEKEIWPHLSPGTKIISQAFPMPHLIPDEKIPCQKQFFYVYIKK